MPTVWARHSCLAHLFLGPSESSVAGPAGADILKRAECCRQSCSKRSIASFAAPAASIRARNIAYEGSSVSPRRMSLSVLACVRERRRRNDVHVADAHRAAFNRCCRHARCRARHGSHRPAVDASDADDRRAYAACIHSPAHPAMGQIPRLVSPDLPRVARPVDVPGWEGRRAHKGTGHCHLRTMKSICRRRSAIRPRFNAALARTCAY